MTAGRGYPLNSKLCSIIIPVYNDWNYLKRLIERILAISVGAAVDLSHLFEVIVIDDGSASDLSAQMPVSPMVTYLRKTNGGVSSARNLGIDSASSDYIMFLDCDDDIPDNLFEIMQRDLVASDKDIHQYSYVTRHEGTGAETRHIINSADGTELFSHFLLKKNSFHICSFIFSMRFLQQHQLRFSEDTGLSEDVLFIFNAFAVAAKVKGFEDVLYYYNIRQGSVISSFKGKRETEHLSAFAQISQLSQAHLSGALQSEANFFLKTCLINLYVRSLKLAKANHAADYLDLLQQMKRFGAAIGRCHYPYSVKGLFVIVFDVLLKSSQFERLSKVMNRTVHG